MISNQDKTAVIFGLRNDLSLAWPIALILKASGCRVALSYTRETERDVRHLAKKEQFDSDLMGEVDVRSETQLKQYTGQVAAETGGIDYVLHAVAFGNSKVMCTRVPGQDAEHIPDFIDIPFEDFIDSFDISAYSLIRVARAVRPHLNSGASLLALTFNASQRVFPEYSGMAVNKAALETIVKYLAHYFGPSKVRVNAISAGMVMTTSAGGIKGARKLRKLYRQIGPLGNVTAEEVAQTALYYLSDLSRKVSGNNHFVDGGFNVMGIGTYES